MSSKTTRSKFVREFCTLRDGRKLAYIVQQQKVDAKERNDGDTLPYVFMFPGMFCTANDVLLQSPPDKYIWVCVDRPGYSRSSSPPDRYSYQEFAADIRELADHLQVTNFYVAGHSSGGPCALACGAHLGDDRVIGIAAIASDAEYVAQGAPGEGSCEKSCLRCVLPCFIIGLSCGGVCGPCSRRLHGYRVDHRLEHEAYDFRTESITQPTLLAYGANDTWARPHSEFIQEQIKDVELMVVSGANHSSIRLEVHMDAIIAKLLSMSIVTEKVPVN